MVETLEQQVRRRYQAYQEQPVIGAVRPTALIGLSTATGAFTEQVVRRMAAYVKRPIIMPLSNPTSRSEARPQGLADWTEGRALVAAGSPFPPVRVGPGPDPGRAVGPRRQFVDVLQQGHGHGQGAALPVSGYVGLPEPDVGTIPSRRGVTPRRRRRQREPRR